MDVDLALFIPSLGIGGAEKNAVILANHLAEQGKTIDLVILRDGNFSKFVSDKVNIVNMNCRIWHAPFRIINYFKHTKPQSILVFMFPFTFLVCIFSILVSPSSKIVLTERTTFSQNFFEKKHFAWIQKLICKIMMHICYSLADTVVLVSYQALKELKRFLKFSNKKINFQVVYNPVEEKIVSTKVPQDLIVRWQGHNKTKLLAVGRLVPAKNYPFLISSFVKVLEHIDGSLLILGDGPERENLEILVRTLGLEDRVLMPGFIDDPSPYYKAADVFILASKLEGFPNVLLEALAHGKKIVSTDCASGPREILDDGQYGILIPVNDEDALVSAILTAIQQEQRIEFIKSRAKVFSVENTISQYQRLLFSSPNEDRGI